MKTSLTDDNYQVIFQIALAIEIALSILVLVISGIELALTAGPRPQGTQTPLHYIPVQHPAVTGPSQLRPGRQNGLQARIR